MDTVDINYFDGYIFCGLVSVKFTGNLIFSTYLVHRQEFT